MKNGFFAFLMAFLFGALAFAQAAPAAPNYADSILAWIAANGATVVPSIVAVLEIVLRIVPSQKPLSILVPVKYFLNAISVLFAFLAGICGQLISSLNNTGSSGS